MRGNLYNAGEPSSKVVACGVGWHPTINSGMQNGSSVGTCTTDWLQVCMLSRCFSTKLLHQELSWKLVESPLLAGQVWIQSASSCRMLKWAGQWNWDFYFWQKSEEFFKSEVCLVNLRLMLTSWSLLSRGFLLNLWLTTTLSCNQLCAVLQMVIRGSSTMLHADIVLLGIRAELLHYCTFSWGGKWKAKLTCI